jgi:ABC-type sugar transport system substrate-binding protein
VNHVISNPVVAERCSGFADGLGVDLGENIVAGIRDGVIEWGIDQQPVVQAYLPVVVLTNYHRYGVLPGNNINSCPGFITADGLEMVEALAGEFRRDFSGLSLGVGGGNVACPF